jgi:hypothetical protein
VIVRAVWDLAAFDRNTEFLEREATFRVPARLVGQAKKLAGITKDDHSFADYPLSSEQATAIAELIDKPIDVERYEYTLEPSAAPT